MNIKKFLFILHFLFFISSVKAINYSDEIIKSYDWAYDNKITTQSPIDNANIYGEITRIELAKMISNYAINVLGNNIESQDECEFVDVSKDLDEQYNFGVLKSCQLGLMGQGIEYFRPYDKVTRAEFGTILSRALYGETFKSNTLYYSRHITALNSLGIMNNVYNVEKTKEIRGYVMLMLKRGLDVKDYELPIMITNNDNIDDIIVQTGNLLMYRNNIYGFEVLLGKKWKNSKIKHSSSPRWGGFFNDSFDIWIPRDFYTKKLTNWNEDCIKQGHGNCVGLDIVNINVSTIAAINEIDEIGWFTKEQTSNMYGEIKNRRNNVYIFNIWNGGYGDIVHDLYDDIYCYTGMTDGIQDIPNERWICPYYFDENFMNNFETFKISS